VMAWWSVDDNSFDDSFVTGGGGGKNASRKLSSFLKIFQPLSIVDMSGVSTLNALRRSHEGMNLIYKKLLMD